MFTVVETAAIDHPADGVFDFVTDASQRPRWDSSVVSEEALTPPPTSVGSRMRSRLKVMGREVEFEWRVTEWDPPRRMTLTSTSGPLPTSMTFDVVADGPGSVLTARMVGDPAGMMRFVEPLIEEGVRTNLSTGVARIRALLEAPASA